MQTRGKRIKLVVGSVIAVTAIACLGWSVIRWLDRPAV
jgi:hypothetical protein